MDRVPQFIGAISDAIGIQTSSRILPPLICIVAEYAKSPPWVFILEKYATGYFDRVAMYDPFMGRRIIWTRSYRYYIDNLYARRHSDNRLFLLGSKFEWSPNIYRVDDYIPNRACDRELLQAKDAEQLHLILMPNPPMKTVFPYVSTDHSLFCETRPIRAWQRFDLATERWDPNHILIPSDCIHTGFVQCVGIGPRSFIAIDCNYIANGFPNNKCYAYDGDTNLAMSIFCHIDMSHITEDLAHFSCLVSCRIGRYPIMIWRRSDGNPLFAIIFKITTEAPLSFGPCTIVELPALSSPTIVKTAQITDDYLYVIQRSEPYHSDDIDATLYQLHLPSLLKPPSKELRWITIGPIPALLSTK